jgi:hypothetical protein
MNWDVILNVLVRVVPSGNAARLRVSYYNDQTHFEAQEHNLIQPFQMLVLAYIFCVSETFEVIRGILALTCIHTSLKSF